ncbi:hypothetical protein AB1Y20_019569 [Prymnesium parvum]|uniref:Chromatin target of PRMT1 protein C-terminal domain-containing protein n=1 Tax=Prymnesium parvum TaxID=97485 RepID=A0AB34JUH0_PRYPA
MVKAAGKPKGTRPGAPARGQPPAKSMIDRPMHTQKGTFEFTLVADGLYIEHKWGKNSGHIGLPLENIPKFIAYLQGFQERVNPSKAPVVAQSKGIVKKAAPKAAPKEKPAKPTLEDLDADLAGYQAARKGDEETAVAL